MKKDIIKKISKAVLFVLIFMLLYVPCREVLRNKSESEALGRIFTKPDGVYDVVLAGSSHMQYGVQPYILSAEYGINACNTATAAQSIPTTYYVVKEMIERHRPKIVVVDLFCLFYPYEYFTPTRFHQAIDNFPAGKNKIEAVCDLTDEGKSEFLLNIMLYHGRWKSLTREDYKVQTEFNETEQLLYATTAFENDFVPLDESVTNEIDDIPLKYLKKIADICKKTDTKLLLTVIPYRADTDNNDVTGIYQQSLYNRAKQYAKEWDVDYVNLLYNLDDMGFDFGEDMAEFSHLNHLGSIKVSRYMGKIISEKMQ